LVKSASSQRIYASREEDEEDEEDEEEEEEEEELVMAN
jgi:hypothetical protein